MIDTLHKKLAEFQAKGYVIAPAGHGKTHLIALSVSIAENRQLILTHTFAGVNSIKAKMNALNVPSSKYHLDTLAGWALRICLAYPKTSGWTIENPSSKQWKDLYESCRRLLTKKFFQQVIRATYSGFYVDEYQDCSDSQHFLVCALSESLPCRILGDPLQAIFEFSDKSVDWEKDIYPYFECLGELEIPWRWCNRGDEGLGNWLKKARNDLIKNGQIDLSRDIPKSVSIVSVDLNDFKNSARYSLFYGFLKNAETVIAIFSGDQQSKNKAHKLAQALGGKFSSIEEVEGKELFLFLRNLQNGKTAKEFFLLALRFSKKCFTGVGKVLVAGTKEGRLSKKTARTKYPMILDAANCYLEYPTIKNLREFFCLIRDNAETHIYRRDLLDRFMNILNMHIAGQGESLLESAYLYQREFRHSGRPVRYSKLIGTTLLVKGLEYDHAVIVNADSLNTKELYVAMTRGSKSLTIVTGKIILPKFR